MSADLSSGDLARATGNTVRTIRFYESEGLLERADVSGGGHRRYSEEDLERLQLITDLRELGLSLGEIRSILELRSGCRTAAEFALRLEQVLLTSSASPAEVARTQEPSSVHWPGSRPFPFRYRIVIHIRRSAFRASRIGRIRSTCSTPL